MKKLFLVIVLTCVGHSIFAQISPVNNSGITLNHNLKETKTLKINMASYSKLTFESLKSELIAWKEKVKSVDISENTNQFTLIHYTIMDNRELFDILTKYNIQKNAIISYQ